MSPRCGGERAGRAGEEALGERRPGDERAPGLETASEDVGGCALGQAEAVLDGHDLGDAQGTLELGLVDVADSDMTDLAFRLELGEGAHRILDRHARVDEVELVEVDPLDAEAAQAPLAGGPQCFGTAVGRPFVGPVAPEAALRRDQEAVVRVEGLAHEALRDFGAVRVRRVDELNAELDGAAQQRSGACRVCRLAPGAPPGEGHRSQTQGPNGEIADRGRAGHRKSSPDWPCDGGGKRA